MADLTPAEELRAAAARLREHAQAATPGPWTSAYPSWAGKNAVLDASGHPVAVCGEEIPGSDRPASADAAWIALAHPGLAGPLAALLDDLADEAEAIDASEVTLGPDATYDTGVTDHRGELRPDLTHALAVARVILGGGRG